MQTNNLKLIASELDNCLTAEKLDIHIFYDAFDNAQQIFVEVKNLDAGEIEKIINRSIDCKKHHCVIRNEPQNIYSVCDDTGAIYINLFNKH